MTSTRFLTRPPGRLVRRAASAGSPRLRGHELLDGAPNAARVDPLARRGLPGTLEQDEGGSLGGSLLVEPGRRNDGFDIDPPVEPGRESVSVEQAPDLLAQLVGTGDPKRGEQSQPDRLPVAVAAVAAGRLDRVADG